MRTQTIQYQEGMTPQYSVPWQVPALLAGLFVVILVAVSVNRRKKQIFDSLATFLQGSVSGGAFLGFFKFRGRYKNRTLKIERRPAGKNTPEWLTLILEGPLFIFDLKVSRENYFKGAMKKIGLMKDIETGDPVFDERFYAASGTRDLAGRYLADAGRRGLIVSAFSSGVYDLEFVPSGKTIPGLLRVRKRNPDLEKDLSMQNLMPLLEDMDRLCSEDGGVEFFGAPGEGGGAKAFAAGPLEHLQP